jgi:hypothetical protein
MSHLPGDYLSGEGGAEPRAPGHIRRSECASDAAELDDRRSRSSARLATGSDGQSGVQTDVSAELGSRLY